MKKFPPLALLLTLTLVGCGSSTTVVVPKPPHNGILINAIEGTNVVEIVRQDDSAGAGKYQFTAYFLNDQLKPLTPAPTAATFKPKSPRDATIAELKPASDPSAMVSPAIEDVGGIGGELTATIDGKPIVFSINVR